MTRATKEKMVVAYLYRIRNGPLWSVRWSYVNNDLAAGKKTKWGKRPRWAYGFVKESDLA